jgi:hypothetical protein
MNPAGPFRRGQEAADGQMPPMGRQHELAARGRRLVDDHPQPIGLEPPAPDLAVGLVPFDHQFVPGQLHPLEQAGAAIAQLEHDVEQPELQHPESRDRPGAQIDEGDAAGKSHQRHQQHQQQEAAAAQAAIGMQHGVEDHGCLRRGKVAGRFGNIIHGAIIIGQSRGGKAEPLGAQHLPPLDSAPSLPPPAKPRH